MADRVECFFFVEADKLQAFVVVVGLLDEVGVRNGWFLDSFLSH